MSIQDLDNAIKSINDSAGRANTTTDFFNRVLDGGQTESVQNPLTGVMAPSVQKAVYDQYKNDINQIHQDVVDSQAAANRAEAAAGTVGPTVDEAIRRSFAEAGYRVVGTFQAGFTYVNANDVGIDKPTGKGYTGPAGQVPAGTNPASGGFVDRSGNIYGSFENPQAVAASSVSVGSRVRIASRNYALFEVKAGSSPYPLVCPQLSSELYLSMVAESGELTSSCAGATDNDDTFILNELIQYGKSINAAVKIDCPMKLKTPLDAHTYIRLPTDFTIYSENPRVYRIMIQPQAGVIRDARLCLETFQGLQGPEPAMCSGTVANDIYLTMNAVDGGQVKVGHCIIGAMFRTMFIRPYASGFSRHNILVCRAWYATIQGPFGRAGKGSGVTIGKHPDVNQAWDGAVNGIEIDEVWGHTNGQDGTWVANAAEDIGYGVGLYGQMFSLHIGKVIAEANQGAGFQSKVSYGDFKIDSMYLETNLGHDYYSAITNSAGISWQTPCVFLSQNADVKVKPDANTTASLIGFPFVISGNVFDFAGVNFANVKLSRQTHFSVRNILGPVMSTDFKIVSSEDANLNSFTVTCKGPNPVSSLEFNNNMELIFVPYQTTASTSQFVYQITKDGVDQGTTLGKSGPFTAYQSVKLTSWSGSYDSFYSFKVLTAYGESCPGRFIIRSRHL
ncbi:MAG: hypothetical protein ACRCYB_08730 [Aeromonas veronii]